MSKKAKRYQIAESLGSWWIRDMKRSGYTIMAMTPQKDDATKIVRALNRKRQ